MLDEQIEFTLLQVCRLCDVNARYVAELVEEGVITPRGNRPASWRFNGINIRRVQVVVRLERDLQINLSGAALVLDLLEELERLRGRRSF